MKSYSPLTVKGSISTSSSPPHLLSVLVQCAEMGVRNTGWFFLYVLFLCFTLNLRLSIGAATLSVGESILKDQTLVSEGEENFELGLFTPDNYQNWYFGIWYRYKPLNTIVWVANRDKPISYLCTRMKLLEDGNLVIIDSSKKVVWSTNLTSNFSNSIEAALLDSGNLVLRDVSNSSNLIWESFDHPTDTWLPGGKIGLHKLTNESQRLTSWKSSEDPSQGLFSLELDPAGSSQLFLLWNGSVKFWSSGTWNGHTFSLDPAMTSNNVIVNFTYVSNQKENYFTYNICHPYVFSRFVVNASGQINLLTWDPEEDWNITYASKKLCGDYAVCGAFATCNGHASPSCRCLPGFNQSDSSGGCMRNTPLQCVNNASVNGEKDGFLKIPDMRLAIDTTYEIAQLGSVQACELVCSNSCSCNAYSYDAKFKSCNMWEGDLLNLEQLSHDDTDARILYLRLAASELLNSTSGDNKKESAFVAIAVSVSGVVALLVFLLVLIGRRRRRNLPGPSEAVEGFLVTFSYKDLQMATKNFSEKLGRGGFGSVFKGTLPNSTIVAVKKLEGLSQGEKQFRTEVSTIGMIQHVNLVRLHGFCCEGSTRRLLVYDFMPKGSLDSHLFHGKKDSMILDWKTRYQIALGTARGLAYLHENCRDCIIHCDIKPENILLDAEFCPMVADFGLAKLVGREFSRVLTTMRGTIGYLAPEWISGVAITAKADVYSYGMMLFELISGKRNFDQSDGQTVRFFPIWAVRKINEDGEILSLLDYRLEGNADLAELDRACKVASWCIQDDEVHRPSMGLVVQILEGIVEVSPPPVPRFLQALAENNEHTVFFSEPSSKQISQAWSPTSGTSSH